MVAGIHSTTPYSPFKNYQYQILIHNVYLFSGHGDSNSKSVPTKVHDIGAVGQVACGSSHTLALSQDARTVWSFGGGDNGKKFDAFL